MESAKREHAIATAGIILGITLQEANEKKPETGTLIHTVDHKLHGGGTEICITVGPEEIESIVLRDRDDHERSEHFDEPITASLRLADCLLHGVGALRREP